jgi:hypothetical protein
MSLGASIVLIAVGAILRFAVTLRSKVAGAWINWHVVGDILIAVGVVGLVISIFWMASLTRRARPVAGERYADAPREPRSMP